MCSDLGSAVPRITLRCIRATCYAYSYDTAGRLTQVSKNGTVIGQYSYDANGNRLTAQGQTAQHDTQDRLINNSGAQYDYSANGELKRITAGTDITHFNYDVLGNLRQVTLPNGTAIDYLIDGSNRRIGKKVNGALVQGLLYQDQLKPIAELDGSGNTVARFVFATKTNVPDYIIKGNDSYRLITDHLGSPRLVIHAATGEIAQRIDYDEYGFVLLDTNPGFQPFGYAGGLMDQHTKLVRFGARDYDPKVGRWTAKDPIQFEGGDSNLYGYVFNDPVNWIDPTGEIAKYCIAAVDKLLDLLKGTKKNGPAIHPGKQGKHQPGHNNFTQGRSEVTHQNPQLLVDKYAGKGQPANNIPYGQPGYRERIDFGENIGNYVDPKTGISSPTTNGIIHYGKDGVHVVPARPNL